MKRLIFITVLAAALLLLQSCDKKDKQERISISTVSLYDSVYMCDSPGAKRFHASETCKGLSNCGGDIIKTSRAEAEDKWRTYCHKCYKK